MLLVCYDENWPAYLDPARGEPAFACALVLAAGAVEGGIAHIGRPHRGADTVKTEVSPPVLESLVAKMPVLAAIPLLGLAAAGGEAQNIPISPVASGWQVKVQPLKNSKPTIKDYP